MQLWMNEDFISSVNNIYHTLKHFGWYNALYVWKGVALELTLYIILMWLCSFPHVDSSVPVSALWGLLWRIHPTVWSPHLSVPHSPSPVPAPRTKTVVIPASHPRSPLSHPHHRALHLPVQPVKASGYSAGPVTPLPGNNQKQLSLAQASPPCISFSITRGVFRLLPRPTDVPEWGHPHVHSPLTKTQRRSTTSQTPLRLKIVPMAPSHSHTLHPAAQRKSPPTISPLLTQSIQYLYVYTNLHYPKVFL